MVNQQPEALRLADELESEGDSWFRERDAEAAAELRRLHAENEDYANTIDGLIISSCDDVARIVALEDLRDELLEALKGVIEVADLHQLYGRRTDAARTAIAKATGETK